MVSIMLLTTEEVLRRNGFWYCLDSDWITVDMEPFEEINPRDLFSKPLSRDFYYSKFPEIPRSESEDENSFSLNGFKSKHREWKSKINVKRFYAQKRNSCSSRSSLFGALTTSSTSLNVGSNKVGSPSESYRCRTNSESGVYANSRNRKRDNDCLPKNISPPPALPIIIITDASRSNSLEQVNYSKVSEQGTDIEQDKLKLSNVEQSAPTTSTIKRNKRKVSFNLNTHNDDFDYQQSWNESIYGLSDFGLQLLSINSSKSAEYLTIDELYDIENDSYYNDFPSWTDIIDECGVSECLLNNSLWISTEELITKSHTDDTKNLLFLEDDYSDDEATYATFAINKIQQTLINDIGMTDSSPMKDFIHEENDSIVGNQVINNDIFLNDVYRIAPKTCGEELTSTL